MKTCPARGSVALAAIFACSGYAQAARITKAPPTLLNGYEIGGTIQKWIEASEIDYEAACAHPTTEGWRKLLAQLEGETRIPDTRAAHWCKKLTSALAGERVSLETQDSFVWTFENKILTLATVEYLGEKPAFHIANLTKEYGAPSSSNPRSPANGTWLMPDGSVIVLEEIRDTTFSPWTLRISFAAPETPRAKVAITAERLKGPARAAAEAERKRAAEAAAARAAILANLPTLNSGLAGTFLGADRKCAQQFQEALNMDGLEKRKRIAELVSYGCGVVVDGLVKVTPGQREAAFVFITIADGKHQGKTGWVPLAWVK